MNKIFIVLLMISNAFIQYAQLDSVELVNQEFLMTNESILIDKLYEKHLVEEKENLNKFGFVTQNKKYFCIAKFIDSTESIQRFVLMEQNSFGSNFYLVDKQLNNTSEFLIDVANFSNYPIEYSPDYAVYFDRFGNYISFDEFTGGVLRKVHFKNESLPEPSRTEVFLDSNIIYSTNKQIQFQDLLSKGFLPLDLFVSDIPRSIISDSLEFDMINCFMVYMKRDESMSSVKVYFYERVQIKNQYQLKLFSIMVNQKNKEIEKIDQMGTIYYGINGVTYYDVSDLENIFK